MKKGFKIIIYSILSFLAFIVIYLGVAFLLSNIIINDNEITAKDSLTIYLKTNGVHLDIIFQKEDIESDFLTELNFSEEEKYFAFGWGDENFYLHTPTWNDLTFKTAFGALFLKSSTLIHVTRYLDKRTSWVEVNLTKTEFQKLKEYLLSSFQFKNNKIQEVGQGYSSNDNFYKANGSYSIFKTCNTWVNRGFKQSGLKACVWTPFDFGVLNCYPQTD